MLTVSRSAYVVQEDGRTLLQQRPIVHRLLLTAEQAAEVEALRPRLEDAWTERGLLARDAEDADEDPEGDADEDAEADQPRNGR